jgi:magnesium and cobalt transporter
MRPSEPEDREDIKAVLEAAHDRQVLDGESYAMISGALEVANQTVADIMVPRSRMDMLDISKPLAEVLPEIIETGHSRFPVYEDDRDNIVGILLAKDLLLSITNPAIDLRPLIRPAVFIPETKRLNVLLHDFRSSRNHLAIVVDEHGGTSGLVTMEDVLEQIVGDIEDEYDEDAEKTIFQTGTNSWRAMGITEIEDFNLSFNTDLPHDDYDTLGGWLAAELGRIPRRGDSISHQGLNITVVGADSKRALWLHIQHDRPDPLAPSGANE